MVHVWLGRGVSVDVPVPGWRALLLAIGTAASVTACLDLSAGCGNEQLSEVASPDRARRAVVFQRDCGATTPFSTQVSILPAGATLPDSSGNVFVADTEHGRADAGPGGGPRVSVRWIAGDTLELRYDPRARIFVQEAHVLGTNVRFVADSGAVR